MEWHESLPQGRAYSVTLPPAFSRQQGYRVMPCPSGDFLSLQGDLTKLLEQGSNLWVKLQNPCSKHQKYVGGFRRQVVWNQSNLWIELHIWWSCYQNDELSPNFMGSLQKFNQNGTNSQFDIQVHYPGLFYKIIWELHRIRKKCIYKYLLITTKLLDQNPNGDLNPLYSI